MPLDPQPSRMLYFYVPGFLHRTSMWEEVVKRLKDDLGGEGEWHGYDHRVGLFSVRDPYDLANELHALVTRLSHKADRKIVLVGHSAGGLLVRAAYLISAGAFGNRELRNSWHDRVDRIVLLASIDRGIGRGNTLIRKLGTWFLGVLRATVPTTFSRLLRGSQFVTDLRISWIRYTNSNSTKPPKIVQVIGTLDQVVSKDDVTDKQQFPHATIIQIPGAGHDRLFDPNSSEDHKLHYDGLIEAFRVDPTTRTPAADTKKNNVVILLHGIRASALDWPNQLAPLIAEESDFMVLCPDYGYFTALRYCNSAPSSQATPMVPRPVQQCARRQPERYFSLRRP